MNANIHPLFAAFCTLSAAIAYVEGWRVGRPREYSPADDIPPDIGADIGRLVVFFADGGDLEYLLQRERFYNRQSLIEHQRRLNNPTLRWV